MANCFYYKDGTKINDIQTLIKQFFEENYQLKNSKIFSSEEIQESTVKKIKELVSAKDYDRTITENESEEEQKGPEAATKFIVKPHPGLYNKLGINAGESGRLAAEYIPENRVYYYIKENLSTIERLPDLINVSDLKYSPKLLESLRTRKDLDSISDNKLIYLLNKIEDIMHLEEKTRDFGILLHNVISLKIQGKEYSNIVRSYLSDPKNAETIGNFPHEDWIQKIDSVVDHIVKKVKDIGVPISEVFISTEGTPVDEWGRGIKGKIDLIAVDTDGDAHIFEIKVSKNPYAKWDSAKKITLDWQLAIYRQLLGQHVNIDSTMLYTIPIIMNELGDPNGIRVEPFANRKVESHSGLNTTGRLTVDANKLIPRKVIVDYDPERENKLKEQLSILIPDYKIETGLEDYDEEEIVKNAKKRYEKEKKWIKWNNFDDIDGLKKGYIESDTEEEFRAKIKLYVKHVQVQTNRNVSILKDAIISAIKTNSLVKTNSYNSDKDATVNHILKEYLNDDWEVVNNIPESLAFGLIVLKNKKNGNVNVLSLSINQFKADSHIKGKNYGDLEYLKCFLFLNEFKDSLLPTSDLPGKNDKIAQIIVYNPIDSSVYNKNCFAKFREFKSRVYEQKMSNQLNLNEENIASIEDIALYNLDVTLRNFSGSDKETVDLVFQKFMDTNLAEIDLDTLIDIQKTLFEAPGFVGYKDKTLTGTVNFDDPKEVLLALLQVAIATKGQMEFSNDFQKLSKLSLGFSDLKSLFSALWTDDQAKYNKEGARIQGIVQGLLWTTPDWVASKDLQNINRMMSMCNQHVGEKMVLANQLISAATSKFYKSKKFSEISRNVIGESQSKHEDLWLHDANQKFSNEFRTKNPYSSDQMHALDDDQREYLQRMLLIINTFRLQIPDSEIKKLDYKSLDSLMTNPKIADAITNGEYFRMPLIRREEVTRFKDIFTTPSKFWKEKLGSYLHELNDYIDPRELMKDDLKNIERQKLGFYEMYDVYARQTPEYVAKGIEKHSVNYFEWNLDTIAHRVAFSKIRKGVYDKKLPIINAFIWWMKLSAGKENEDISNQLQYISDQMSLSVFDKPIIDEEFKDYAKVAAMVKAVSTPAMLGFKVASLIKEMTIGAFKGISLAATQMFGKDLFTAKDLASAYGKLMTIDNKFSNEFNLIDNLNNYYRFANMDINTVAKKLQSDRRGFLRGAGRYLYMCNTIPDYYNRLSIFLAKMIHDGSYEAHSLVNGQFIYDPRKDKRFEYYLANREKHMKNGQYIAATGDLKYNQQRQLYLLLQQQLNKEYGKDTFTEGGDLVNKAYSLLERNSMKSMTDMAYGYYDKDAQSQANNTWWGMTWLNFMQFWPGKMKMWFAKPTSAEDSPMGKIVHDFVMEDGKKILQYHKTVEDEDGNISTVVTDEDTGDPVLKWTGTPYEGLWYSVVGTLRDVATLDFKHIKGNEERNRRALFALADAGLIFIMLGIMKAILDAMIAEKGTEGLSGTLLMMSGRINNKVLNEYNVWQSTLGAVNSTPVFLSWGKKMSGDMWDAVTGDKDLMDVMTRNVGAAEVFKGSSFTNS